MLYFFCIMRTESFKPGCYYRLYNTGVAHLPVFLDDSDYYRFLFLILHYQSPKVMRNTAYYADRIERDGGKGFRTSKETIDLIDRDRTVNLLGYSLTRDGYSLLVYNLGDLSSSVYMQRVLTAYSKYFNKKYGRVGPVFAGPFRYISLGNRKANAQKVLNDLHSSESIWTSAADYSHNRWERLLDTKTLADRKSD